MTTSPAAPAPLLDRVAQLVEWAAEQYAGTDGALVLDDVSQRLHEPLRVAIAGKAKAGKSTLLNALVGEVIAPTGAGESTRLVTWYREGLTYRATVEPRHGPPIDAAVRRDGNGVEVDLDGLSAADVERIVVEWPSRSLRAMTLIDTPGVGSLSPDVGRRSISVVASDDEQASPADAVIYLTRHLHAADVQFLDAFHDDSNARATPVNALAVLSRADEIGGARADSLVSAGRIAARYRTEPTLRRLCQTVVPVAGLLAQGAVTLTEAEHQAFRRFARAADDDAEALLLSADRFARAEVPGLGLLPAERQHLLDRFGIFGVRLARALLRHGEVDSARRLGEELRRRSGLDELRELLVSRFGARRDVLKARSALLAVGDLLRRMPLRLQEGVGLRAELERISASAHELAELRILLAVRAGAVPLDDDASLELERILGSGGDAAERLGVVDDDPATARDALVAAVNRWRARGDHPLAPPSVVEASQVVVRTLEGLFAAR